MRFLFWNIRKNSIGRIISQIVNEHNVEVVIIAECLDESTILRDLNANTETLFHLTESNGTRVVVYSRFPREYLQSEYNDNFVTIRRMCLPARRELLLAAVHFPSKLFADEGHQWATASRTAAKIREVELRVGLSRTVLVGDLNMNPFEKGVISANGLHAVMTRETAGKIGRTISGESYPFFYNPMWGRFGDSTEGPPGTYYRGGSSSTEYFWYMFDQVLIRPDLMDSLDNASVKVLSGSNGTTFLRSSGVPDASRVSDHLPVLFDLKL